MALNPVSAPLNGRARAPGRYVRNLDARYRWLAPFRDGFSEIRSCPFSKLTMAAQAR